MDAVLHVRAAFRVLRDVSCGSPVVSLVLLVVEQMRLSPEVLPVVRVHAVGFMMVLAERTPFCLEVKHIEVAVLR